MSFITLTIFHSLFKKWLNHRARKYQLFQKYDIKRLFRSDLATNTEFAAKFVNFPFVHSFIHKNLSVNFLKLLPVLGVVLYGHLQNSLKPNFTVQILCTNEHSSYIVLNFSRFQLTFWTAEVNIQHRKSIKYWSEFRVIWNQKIKGDVNMPIGNLSCKYLSGLIYADNARISQIWNALIQSS